MRFIVAAIAAFLVLMLDIDLPSDNVARFDQIALSHSRLSEAFLNAMAHLPTAKASQTSGEELTEEPVEASKEASADPLPPGESSNQQEAVSAADAFCHALRESAEASNIPVPFFARLIWQESRFRSDEVSHAGAQGVAQFMPQTAAEMGLDDPFDPMKALPASAKLLSKLRADFGNLGLAAAAYNAGSGRIQKWLARQSELPRETRDYVRIITGTKAEDWIEDADMLAIRVDLPRGAPCEGVGGLSKAKDVAFVSATPAASVSALIRKAEAAEAAARLAAQRIRKRLVLIIKKTAPAAEQTRGKARNMIAARAVAKKTAKGRAIRVASAERSSN